MPFIWYQQTTTGYTSSTPCRCSAVLKQFLCSTCGMWKDNYISKQFCFIITWVSHWLPDIYIRRPKTSACRLEVMKQWCLMMLDDVWWRLMTFDDTWWCLMTLDNAWWCLMMFDDTWWFFNLDFQILLQSNGLTD